MYHIETIFRSTSSFLVTFLTFLIVQQSAAQACVEQFLVPPIVSSSEDLYSSIRITPEQAENKAYTVKISIYDLSNSLLYETQGSVGVEPQTGMVNSVDITYEKDYSGVLEDYLNEVGALTMNNMKVCAEIVGSNCPPACADVNSSTNVQLALQYPFDKETINALRPSLFWAYGGHSSQTTYRITLKEHEKGKKKIQSMKMGRTLYVIDRVEDLFVDYPIEIEDLVEGESYVWQVEVFLGNLSLGLSEIWEFTVGEPMDFSEIPVSKSYVDLSEQSSVPLLHVLGTVKFKYNEDKGSRKVFLEIYKESGKKGKLKKIGEQILEANMGQNYFDVELSEKYNLIHKKKYLVLIRFEGIEGEKRIKMVYYNPLFVR